jgi:hypothetical protein
MYATHSVELMLGKRGAAVSQISQANPDRVEVRRPDLTGDGIVLSAWGWVILAVGDVTSLPNQHMTSGRRTVGRSRSGRARAGQVAQRERGRAPEAVPYAVASLGELYAQLRTVTIDHPLARHAGDLAAQHALPASDASTSGATTFSSHLGQRAQIRRARDRPARSQRHRLSQGSTSAARATRSYDFATAAGRQ